MHPKLTIEDFITRARKVHGDKYDYSKVDYINSHTKVCIKCPSHGEFWQQPSAHWIGRGCDACAREASALQRRKLGEKECRQIALKYTELRDFRSLEKAAYKAALKHGWLSQYTWLSHAIKQSIKKPRRTYNTEDIIARLKERFGDTYSYEKVVYVRMKTPITLTCHCKDDDGIEHGEFNMRPDNIFSGNQACPKCYDQRRSIQQQYTTEDFIRKAYDVHGHKYDYHKVRYNGSHQIVVITCPIHGDFGQIAPNHLNGYGCPYCSNSVKKWNKETCLDAARKYEYLYDYMHRTPGAYNKALKEVR